ncbi:MAG: hypothetical protein KJ880_08660 [Candidatus Omnitrophica bacterium]|nr:hypothetical protein [Candidatus Omnitrophota bacterium]
MKNYLQKKTAILIIAVIFFIQSTSLFAYIGNKADYNKDLEETLTTAYEKSPKLISASLSFYVGSVFSSDFINYAKSMGLEEGKADRWLTESRLISTFTNAFNLYASYEKGDSIGMTASAIKVLLNLNSFDALKVIKIAYPYGPIISLLLTGAQVTAESYRAVAQTGREVDIERLYIMLRQDKKLRPEKGELINMDTRENVNYVFDKFLMSGNAEFRRLINSYLVEKLGKSIPTEDIKNRFNFNTGMAYEGPAETAMTIEEFYNQNKPEILTYLAALLKEVNLLLKAQFEEIKLRKEIIAKKAELEKLDYLAKTFGNLFERWDDMIKANKALIEKYEPIARNFNARLEDAKRQNVGTAAREVRDEAQFAIMTMEERGYYTEDKQANVINVALMGNRVMDILNILRPGLKQAAALAKALGEKEDAEEKKAYEEYVKQSQKIIEGFVSFKLDKYPLDAKMAEFKEKIDKYFREGGINGTEIFNSLELDKFSEEFDTFYKKQWEEQKQANIEKFKELDKKWQSIDVPWEKSEEFMGFANSKDYVAFEKAKEAYYKRRDEKFAEVDKIREKVSAAWNVFCLDFETNSGFTAGSLTGGGGDASSYVLGGQGFYTFVPLLRERIAAWERIIKIAGQEQGDIYSNAQPPALLNDVESWIKFNDKVISVVEKLPYPEANFNKIPGIDENNLNETLQKLNDALSQREAAFSEDFSAYFDSTVSTETELSFSIVSNQIKKLDGYIQELKTYIERRNKANSQADAALAKWKITPSAGIDTTIGAAEKLIKNFEKFKRTVPEALKKLEGLYESARDEVAGQRGFIQGRIVLVKSLISLPLLANFEKIKGDIKAGYPLKASYINEGAKGYLNKDEINKLKDGISKTMTPERMQSLASSSPKLHKQVVEITDLVSKIKPVEKNEVVGFDGKTILNASEQEAQLNKANTLSELNALNWETALTNNSIDIESNNQFAVNYRKRLKELKEKEDIATEMARKASMPVVIQSVKVNGKPFTAEPIEVDFAKDKSISITGEIESGVKPREVTFSTEKTDFIKGNLSSSQERGDKVITTFSYSLPIGNVAGTSGKVTIGSSAGGSNGYQEILIKVSQASQDAALAGLKKFLDEAGKIQPGPNAAANFEKIRNDMVSYLKTSGLEQGSAEVVRIMNEISTIQSGLSAQSGPIGFPAGQKPPPTTGPMDYYLLNPRLNSFGLNTASVM